MSQDFIKVDNHLLLSKFAFFFITQTNLLKLLHSAPTQKHNHFSEPQK
jgi:hypothetical protein